MDLRRALDRSSKDLEEMKIAFNVLGEKVRNMDAALSNLMKRTRLIEESLVTLKSDLEIRFRFAKGYVDLVGAMGVWLRGDGRG